MFYVDLKISEENSTPTSSSAVNTSCGDIITPSDRPPIKKRSEKTFNLPKKRLPEYMCNNKIPSNSLINSHHDVKGGTYELPTPMKSTQDPQRVVDPMVQEYDPKKDKSHENIKDSCAETLLKKRMYVLRELVATEESYVQDLSLIVDGYMREMKDPESEIPLPVDLKGGKERIIFGNLAAIYEWHKYTFLELLKRCIQCPTDLGPVIQKCKPKFRMYVIYCQNKPVSEHIVAEHFRYFDAVRLKLKLKLVINALLIKPVQRIMQYELLLRSYLKYTERAGLVDEIPVIQEAINVIKDVPSEANDMMVVGRLQNFEDEITAQGKLLFHGLLLCVQVDSNKDTYDRTMDNLKEVQVFLFEKIIIFSDIVGKKTQFTDPVYIYKAHLQVNRMKVKKLMYNRILLRSTDPERQELNFVLMGRTQEDYREWADQLISIRRKQTAFLEVLQNPVTSKSTKHS
ncbi:rho guanine nucleotide exchange factor 25-like [Bradysia coprophila]|uniref:rho guanine nucleotide exchange factor 25-like n=1 Tax=Bradysia coprophila TaxID=38358 RepID=UPI00187DCB5A|nr:rho guanine nucleotide exchange factor 25-like [Bradysia coprophila]